MTVLTTRHWRFIVALTRTRHWTHLEPHESSPHPSTQFNIHFNLILPYTPRSSKLSLSFRLSNQNWVRILSSPECDMSSPHHHPWFDNPSDGVPYCPILSSLLSLHPSYDRTFSSASCFQTPSTFVLPSMWNTKCGKHGLSKLQTKTHTDFQVSVQNNTVPKMLTS
jgi:hypothetical protein